MANKELWYQRTSFHIILSVVAALGMISTSYAWSDLVRQAEQEFVYTFQVDTSEGYMVTSPPVEVRVVVLGSERERQKLANQTQRRITGHNVRLTTPGQHTVPIPVPESSSRLRVLRMEPTAASVNVVSLETHEVRLRPEIEGELAENYRIDSVTITPSEVEILIPSSIEVPTELRTLPINIQDLDSSKTFANVGLQLPEFSKVRNKDHERVDIALEVVPVRDVHLLDPQRVEVPDAPSGYLVDVYPSYVSVQVQMFERDEEIGSLRAFARLDGLPRDEDGALIEGSYPNIEVQVSGYHGNPEDLAFRPDAVTLEVRKAVRPSSESGSD